MESNRKIFLWYMVWYGMLFGTQALTIIIRGPMGKNHRSGKDKVTDMAGDAVAFDSLFNGGADQGGPAEDNDVSGMYQALVGAAHEHDTDIEKTKVAEPGAIVETIKMFADIIDEQFPWWPSQWKQLALGALVIYKKRFATDAGVHDHVELLHALCRGKCLRAHGGSAHTLRQGAWLKHKGIPSEGLLFIVKNQLLALDGLCIWLAQNGSTAQSHAVLLEDINKIYTVNDAYSVEGMLNAIMDKARFQVSRGAVEGADVQAAVAGVGAPNGLPAAQKRFTMVADVVRKWSASMQAELLAKQIYQMYGAWCSTPKRARRGFCSQDLCIMFTDEGIEYVDKSGDNDIYLFIDTPITDPVLDAHVEKLARAHATTYFRNKAAFESELSAATLALMGRNVDRAFHHLGSGGAGQSVTTSHFDALMCGLHAFLAMNIYFSDDELRKQGDLLIDMLWQTGQEQPQGTTGTFRFDLLKKHLSADPVAMRLLYSIVTKMEALIGWKRYECNILPRFTGITEVNFNSLMRRSWVMQMKATFLDAAAYARVQNPESKGVFLKDPSLKDFVVSEPAKAAGWKILRGWMAAHNEKACYDTIEAYVDGHDKGLTRRCMRFAAGLPLAPVSPDPVGPPPDPVDLALTELRKDHDALIGFCLDNDHEYMTEALCRVATCIPGGNFAQRRAYFLKMVSNSLWKPSVKPQGNSHQTYVPMIKTLHGLTSVYPQGAPPELVLKEEHDKNALSALLANSSRQHNLSVRTVWLGSIRDANAPLAGRPSPERKAAYDEANERLNKIRNREANLRRVADRISPQVIPDNGGKVSLQTAHTTKYPRMSRVRSDGIQGLPKIAQRVSNPELEEIDMKASQWCFIPHIVDRVKPQFNHPPAGFPSVREYFAEPGAVHEVLSPNTGDAKQMCMQSLNGCGLP